MQVKSTRTSIKKNLKLPPPSPKKKKHPRMTCMDFQTWWAFFTVTFGKQVILLFNRTI